LPDNSFGYSAIVLNLPGKALNLCPIAYPSFTLRFLQDAPGILPLTVLWLIHQCALLLPNPAALCILVWPLGTVFHSSCAWNYYPSDLSSS